MSLKQRLHDYFFKVAVNMCSAPNSARVFGAIAKPFTAYFTPESNSRSAEDVLADLGYKLDLSTFSDQKPIRVFNRDLPGMIAFIGLMGSARDAGRIFSSKIGSYSLRSSYHNNANNYIICSNPQDYDYQGTMRLSSEIPKDFFEGARGDARLGLALEMLHEITHIDYEGASRPKVHNIIEEEAMCDVVPLTVFNKIGGIDANSKDMVSSRAVGAILIGINEGEVDVSGHSTALMLGCDELWSMDNPGKISCDVYERAQTLLLNDMDADSMLPNFMKAYNSAQRIIPTLQDEGDAYVKIALEQYVEGIEHFCPEFVQRHAEIPFMNDSQAYAPV